jgi:hypothetical protein
MANTDALVQRAAAGGDRPTGMPCSSSRLQSHYSSPLLFCMLPQIANLRRPTVVGVKPLRGWALCAALNPQAMVYDCYTAKRTGCGWCCRLARRGRNG